MTVLWEVLFRFAWPRGTVEKRWSGQMLKVQVPLKLERPGNCGGSTQEQQVFSGHFPQMEQLWMSRLDTRDSVGMGPMNRG